MKSTTSTFLLVGLAVTLAGACGGSSGSGGAAGKGGAGTGATSTGAAGTTSAAGTSGAAGTTGAAGTGAAGTTSAAGTSGAAGTTGAAGTGTAGTGAAGTGTAGTGAAGTGAAGTGVVDPNIAKVVQAGAGCGKDPTGLTPGTAVRGTITTMGTKEAGCADQKCGDWMYEREYFVTLPTGYDKAKAYPVVFQGPGCGGTGAAIYPLESGVGNSVILVGLTPPPNAIGHATNPNQGCFDDKEGDDSVDWTFYENLWDKLAGQVCFDKNRVFAGGNASGAWLANELGCKYAGDAAHPIRAVLPNMGTLPTDPRFVPTCTKKPLAGMWIWETGDGAAGFPTTGKIPVARAMSVNGCSIGTNVDNATFESFPIGGNNPDTTCKKVLGCPELYPLVVCIIPGNAHGSHDTIANPGFATFIKLFSKAPLLTP